MIYLALLRGINVGGNNKVSMSLLKELFESLGFTSVKTYINSGNVIFVSDSDNVAQLTALLEAKIEQTFGFAVKVLIRDYTNIGSVASALPDTWQNDAGMKCDVLFMWEDYDSASVLEQLPMKPGIDTVTYVPGAIFWKIDRADATRSGLSKLVGTDLYKHMTIRNCNTVRKFWALMRATKLEQS